MHSGGHVSDAAASWVDFSVLLAVSFRGGEARCPVSPPFLNPMRVQGVRQIFFSTVIFDVDYNF